MPEEFDSSENALELTCPDCGATDSDAFEVIEPRTLTRLQCWSCQVRFHVWLDECRVCGEERLATLPEDAKSAITRLPDECATCHVRGAFHEDQCCPVEAVA